MIKRILRLPAMPTSFVLVALAGAVAAMMHNWALAFLIPYCGVLMTLLACMVANSVRFSRMERHPLAALSDKELRYLCRQHPDIEVRFYDSVRAGNCMPGTRQFVKRTFKGRRSITLPELARYAGAFRVKNVIVYKLKEAKVDWKTERDGYLEAQRNGSVAAADQLAAA
jgi:hypothetical protein